MAYDEDLADRIRAAIPDPEAVTERRMFGGLAFLVNGHLAVSASSQGGLLLRVDPAETDSFVNDDDVTRFTMRGRDLNGWLHVHPSATDSDEELRRWVEIGVAYAGSLPSK